MAKVTAGPFSGLRVLDLAGIPGALATKQLANFGAEVIAVEPPGGEITRHLPPFKGRTSLWWAYFGQGKRSVVLDLATAPGRRNFQRLVATADVVLESAPPGALDAQGIGYQSLSAHNPRVVWVAITPFGQSGPKRDWQGSDMIFWASSGILKMTGFPGETPVVPAGPALLGSHLTSVQTAVAILVALRARKRTGRGQFIDVSMQECGVAISPEVGAVAFMDSPLGARRRRGNRRESPFGLFATKDGWASMVILSPSQFQAFGEWVNEVLGIDALLDPSFRDRRVRLEAQAFIDDVTEQFAARFYKRDLQIEGQRRGIPCVTANTVGDLAQDEHLEAYGFWRTVEDSTLGAMRTAGPPFVLANGGWETGPAPRLGEHTRAVLAALRRAEALASAR